MLPGLVLTRRPAPLLPRPDEPPTSPTSSPPSLLLGIGAGTAFMPLLAPRDGPRSLRPDAGLGSGMINVSLQMSAAIGLAVLGTISTDHARSLDRRTATRCRARSPSGSG